MENITFIQFLEKVDIISNRNQSADTIREANQALSLFKKENENLFLTYSVQVLTQPNATNAQIEIGITFIRSIFQITRFHSINYILNYWTLIPQDQRNQFKLILLRQLVSTHDEIRDSSIYIISKILPKIYPEEWPDFYENLRSLQQEFPDTSSLGILKLFGETLKYGKFILPRYFREFEQTFQFLNTLTFENLKENAGESNKQAASFLLANLLNSFRREIKKSNDFIEKSFEFSIHNFLIENYQLHDQIYYFFRILISLMYDKLSQNHIEQLVNAILINLRSRDENIKKSALTFLRNSSKDENSQPFLKICSQILINEIIQLLPNISDSFVLDGKDESLGHFAYHALKSFSLFDSDKTVFNVIKAYFNEKKSDSNVKVRCSSIIALKAIVNNSDIGEFVRSINQDLLRFSVDENLIVRHHFYSFVSKYVINQLFYVDVNENIRFVVNFSKELLDFDPKTAIFGCKIIRNCLNDNFFNIPFSQEEFFSILNAFFIQFDRPDINELKFNEFLRKAIIELLRFKSFDEVSKQFCIELFNKIREFAEKNMNEQLSAVLSIFSHCLQAIRSFLNYNYDEFIEESFNFIISLLPRRNDVQNIMQTIGNMFITFPTILEHHNIDELLNCLSSSLSSNNQKLIMGSTIVIGDIFRNDIKKVIEYVPTFCSKIIENIENDDLPNEIVDNLMLTLGDIFKYTENTDVLLQFRDRVLIIIRNFNNFQFNSYNEDEVDQMTDLFEGLIYLSGSVFQAFSSDEQFISNRENIEILFSFRIILRTSLFPHKKIGYSLLLFLNSVLQNRAAARSVNIYLNHINIKNQLKYFSEHGDENLSKKSRNMLNRLLNT